MDEPFQRLQKEYEGTKIISIVQRDDETPRVQWDSGFSENDVIANLVKALLFMTIDEYVVDLFEEMILDDGEETGEK